MTKAEATKKLAFQAWFMAFIFVVISQVHVLVLGAGVWGWLAFLIAVATYIVVQSLFEKRLRRIVGEIE